MGDGKFSPQLRPPPRVPATVAAGTGTDPRHDNGSTGHRRQISRVAVITAMVVGLVAVFVLLPRWQEKRQNRLTTGGQAREAAPSPEIPHPTDPGPVATAVSTISEPNPIPPPSPTSRPTPARSRSTPREQLSTDETQYIAAMSEGLTALENRRWQAAQSAFEQASRLRPGTPEVADGLARAMAGQRLETVADSLRRARELERSEAWREAERTFSALLAIDPESAEAIDGRRRTDSRARLDEKIEFHLATPGRLSTPEVFSDAASALEEALDTAPSGPRLELQIAHLETLLELASTPVAVVLESDENTDVVVHRVGRMGTFSRRELSLKPGTYTVVGSRDGYRDVRLRLVVPPGSSPKPLAVKCTERL